MTPEAFDALIAPLEPLPTRAVNILSNMVMRGLFGSLQGLAELGPQALLRQKYCGPRTARAIREAMWRAGFPMGEAPTRATCPKCGARLT